MPLFSQNDDGGVAEKLSMLEEKKGDMKKSFYTLRECFPNFLSRSQLHARLKFTL